MDLDPFRMNFECQTLNCAFVYASSLAGVTNVAFTIWDVAEQVTVSTAWRKRIVRCRSSVSTFAMSMAW